MQVERPFQLFKWIEENKHLFKPPVGNETIYKQAGTFIVMVVGGPNSRKDFHFNESEINLKEFLNTSNQLITLHHYIQKYHS